MHQLDTFLRKFSIELSRGKSSYLSRSAERIRGTQFTSKKLRNKCAGIGVSDADSDEETRNEEIKSERARLVRVRGDEEKNESSVGNNRLEYVFCPDTSLPSRLYTLSTLAEQFPFPPRAPPGYRITVALALGLDTGAVNNFSSPHEPKIYSIRVRWIPGKRVFNGRVIEPRGKLNVLARLRVSLLSPVKSRV